MGFLHIGWDLATTEDADERSLMTSSPAWEAASKVRHDATESIGTLLPCHLLWTKAAVNIVGRTGHSLVWAGHSIKAEPGVLHIHVDAWITLSS